mmetsp:Transcript_34078/g.108362  ORF Transcript_34078/g.108362 Transcript_34078/m.108362 type:complete len:173 (-) Transcript_34078:329-847(-)
MEAVSTAGVPPAVAVASAAAAVGTAALAALALSLLQRKPEGLAKKLDVALQGHSAQPQPLPDLEEAGAELPEGRRQQSGHQRSRLPRILRFLAAEPEGEAEAGSAFELDDRAWLQPAQAAAAPSLAQHYIGDAGEEAEAGGHPTGRQSAAAEGSLDAFQLSDSVWRAPMLAV